MEEAGRLPASQRVWDRKPEHLVRTHGWRRDSNLTVAACRWSLFGSAAAQYCSRDCCPHLSGTTDRCVVARLVKPVLRAGEHGKPSSPWQCCLSTTSLGTRSKTSSPTA